MREGAQQRTALLLQLAQDMHLAIDDVHVLLGHALVEQLQADALRLPRGLHGRQHLRAWHARCQAHTSAQAWVTAPGVLHSAVGACERGRLQQKPNLADSTRRSDYPRSKHGRPCNARNNEALAVEVQGWWERQEAT